MGAPSPSSPLSWFRAPCGKKPLASALALVLQACPPPTPHAPLFPTTKQKHSAMWATGAGGSDWERKEGGRKGGPVKGKNLSGRNISVDILPGRITRRKHQRMLLNVRWPVTFVWDRAILVLEEQRRGRETLVFCQNCSGLQGFPAQLSPPPVSPGYRQKPPIHWVEPYGKKRVGWGRGSGG